MQSISKDVLLELSSEDLYDSHTALRHAQALSAPAASVILIAAPGLLNRKAFKPFLKCAKKVPAYEVLAMGVPTLTKTGPASASAPCSSALTHPHVVRVCAHAGHVHNTAQHYASFDSRIGGRAVRTLLDTGATVSCVSAAHARACGARVTPLQGDTAEPVQGLGGQVVPLGTVAMAVKFKNFHAEHQFLVMEQPLAGYHSLLGQDFMRTNSGGLSFTPSDICFTLGTGDQQITLTRKLLTSAAVSDSVHTCAQTPASFQPAPAPASRREKRKMLKSIRLGKEIGYRFVLTAADAGTSAADTGATSEHPGVQQVIDKHSGPGGTLCGKIPDHTTAKGFECEL